MVEAEPVRKRGGQRGCWPASEVVCKALPQPQRWLRRCDRRELWGPARSLTGIAGEGDPDKKKQPTQNQSGSISRQVSSRLLSRAAWAAVFGSSHRKK